jgi:hypothetical protein
VTVRWAGRDGVPAAIAVSSLVAGMVPALSGRLLSPPVASVHNQPLGRSAFIPPRATDLGDGRSVFLPPGSQGVAWVFDNASAQVTGICSVPAASSQDGVTADDLTRCVVTQALLLSGHVRFATGATAGAAEAEHPTGSALDLDMRLSLREGSAPSTPACIDDASPASGSTDVAFHCLVVTDPRSGTWSGTLDVLPRGWLLSHDAAGYRVCRYSADHDGRDGISNEEHPLDYRSVKSPLEQQNFLVVRGSNACPTDVPADLSRADAVNSSTVEQAPVPTESR